MAFGPLRYRNLNAGVCRARVVDELLATGGAAHVRACHTRRRCIGILTRCWSESLQSGLRRAVAKLTADITAQRTTRGFERLLPIWAQVPLQQHQRQPDREQHGHDDDTHEAHISERLALTSRVIPPVTPWALNAVKTNTTHVRPRTRPSPALSSRGWMLDRLSFPSAVSVPKARFTE